MTIGITPSSMQVKRGKRLNRNNSGVAPSKFIFGLTVPYRSVPLDILLQGGRERQDDRSDVPSGPRVERSFLSPRPRRRRSSERDPSSCGGSRRRGREGPPFSRDGTPGD